MEFELISLVKSKQSENIIKANKLVEKFISKNELIIYGGTAIDFALRLKGSFIYNDDLLPFADYDFFSPHSVQDAYKFSLELHNNEFQDVTAAGALYIRTMRVGFEGFVIADISYIPQTIFKNINYLTYTIEKGIDVKLVHPTYQVIDMHLSLSFPYINPPQEAVNHRAEKDIKRYNLLYDHYIGEFLESIVNASNNSLEICEYEIPTIIWNQIESSNCLLIGFIALGYIQNKASLLGYKYKHCFCKWEPTSRKLSLHWNKKYKLHLGCMASGQIEITNYPILDYLPKSRVSEDDTIISSVYMSITKMFPSIIDNNINMSCIQHILFYLSVYANLLISDKEEVKLYWLYYKETLELLNFLCEISKEKDPDFISCREWGTTCWPSESEKNISESIQFWLDVTEASIKDSKNKTVENTSEIFSKKPKNFIPAYPGSEKLLESIIKYDYNSEYFLVDGSKI